MALNIRSATVNQLVETLAARRGINTSEAVKLPVENELCRLNAAIPMRDRLRPLQAGVLARPPTGLEAGEAFYDALSGDC